MKMTLENVLIIHDFLEMISKRKFPVQMSYIISKNFKKFEEEKALIEKSRIDLNEQYCERDEEGNPKIENDFYVFTEENLEKYRAEYRPYLQTEIEMEIHKIPFAEIWKLEEARYDALSPDEITKLEFMLEEE